MSADIELTSGDVTITIEAGVREVFAGNSSVGVPAAGDYHGGYVVLASNTTIADAVDGLNKAIAFVSGAIDGSAIAGDGKLGNPTTGTWSGYLGALTSDSRVADAIKTLGDAATTINTSASTGVTAAQSAATSAQQTATTAATSAATAQSTATAAQNAANAPGMRSIGIPSSGTWAAGYAAVDSAMSLTDSVALLNVALRTVATTLGQAQVGTPTDGSWASGYAAISASTKFADAVDLINTGLAGAVSAAATAQSTANTALSGANSPGQAQVGTPTDSSWVGGYANITSSTKIVDAIDGINTALSSVSAATTTAIGTATTAVTNAATAQSTANTGVSNAAAALAAANAAQSTANSPGSLAIGTPSDGSWSPGYMSLTASTHINDAVDLINEGLANAIANAATAQSTASTAVSSAAAALSAATTAQSTANAPGQQALGNPTSGGLSGYLPLSTATKIVDSIQAINSSMTGFITGSGGTVATLAITTLTAGTLGVSGQTTLAALSAANTALSGTLGVSGATTLSGMSATTGAFSGAVTAASTLSVTGSTTLAAMSAATGTFSGALVGTTLALSDNATIAAGKQIKFGADATGSAIAQQAVLIGNVDTQTNAVAGAQGYNFGYNAIVIGSGAKVLATGSADSNIAIGTGTLVQSVTGGVSAGSCFRNIAVGLNAGSQGYRNASLGNGGNTSGTYNVAIGDYAACGDLYGTGIVQVQRSTAIGKSASVQHDYSTAIGQAATTTAAHQVMLGTAAEQVVAPGTMSVTGALSGSAATFSGAVSAGTVSIGTTGPFSGSSAGVLTVPPSFVLSTGTTDGFAATQNVYIGAIDSTIVSAAGAEGVYVGSQAGLPGTDGGNVAAGTRNNSLSPSTGRWNTCIGNWAAVVGTALRGVAIGPYTTVSNDRGVAVGSNSKAGLYGIGLGYLANGDITQAIAIGHNANASGGTAAIAIGQASSATGATSIAIGSAATAQVNSIAIGNAANANNFTQAVAIGIGATVTANQQIMLGTSSNTVVHPGPSTFTGLVSGVNASLSGTLGVSGVTTLAALNATTGTFSGAVSGASYSGGAISGTTGTFSGAVGTGALTAASANVTGALSGSTLTLTGLTTAAAANYSGALTAASYSGGAVSGTTGTFSGAVSGASYSGGPISGTTGTFSGAVSGFTQILAPNGLVATPALSFANSPTTGIWSSGTNTLDFSTAGVVRLSVAANGTMTSSYTLTVSNAVQSNAFRAQTTSATANFDGFQFTSGNTTAAASTLAQGATSRLITNTGAAAQTVITLPAAAVGLWFVIENENATGLQLKAPAGVTISFPGQLSSSGGTQTTATVGASAMIVAVTSTKWVAIGMPSGLWMAA